MRFIKTYWHDLEGQPSAPFLSKVDRAPLYTFALSSLSVADYHDVELYTDKAGAAIISELNLPFKNVHVIKPVSRRYKSLNDLFVLSLQNGPVTLIQDNIFIVSKLHIPVKDIMVLGLDINSFKLVKSVIKMMRICPEIEGFDDKYLNGKSSYIDTSLISLSNGKNIAEYIRLILNFTETNSAALSEYDNYHVNNFLRTYWLFSWMRARGVQVDFFHKDPLSVSLSGNSFDLSVENITQGIFKIYDHNFQSMEFNKYFLAYFRNRFEDHYKSVRKLLRHDRATYSRQKSLRLYRTRYVFERLKNKVHENPAFPEFRFSNKFISHITARLAESASPEETVLLNDAYFYEAYLQQVYRYYRSEEEAIGLQENKAFGDLLKYWDIPAGDFRKLKLCLNPYLLLVESKWKWCTAFPDGAGPEKLAELKVIYNENVSSSYFITAFIPNADEKYVYEFNIDRRTAEIIDFFDEERSINDYFASTAASRNAETAETDPKEHNDEKRIRELLRTNLMMIYG